MEDGSSDGSASRSRSSEKKSQATTKKSKAGSEKQSESKAGKSGMESAEDQDVDDDEISGGDDEADQVTQNNMRDELIKAIKDEHAEYKQLKETNL